MHRLGMKQETPGTWARSRSPLSGLALGLAAAVALTACQDRGRYGYQAPPLSAEERFPIVLEEEPVILEVPVVPSSYGLSEGQRVEIFAFLRAYRDGATGPLVVRTPSGTRNESAAGRTVEEVRELAARADVPAASLKYQPYSGHRAGSDYPPVILAYRGVKARAAECGDWSENAGVNPENKPYLNFGCATQRNLAAMAADPRDLARPRATDPVPAERRQTVRDKYIRGEPTGAQSAEEENGSVSTVGQ